MASEQFANDAITTLAANVDLADLAIEVSDASSFPSEPQFRIRLDSELLLVTALVGTTWTVERGWEDTTVETHTSGANVTLVVTAEVMSELASISPGGADTNVQFNDSGGFGGDMGFTFDKTTKELVVTDGTRICHSMESSSALYVASGAGDTTNIGLTGAAGVFYGTTGLSINLGTPAYAADVNSGHLNIPGTSGNTYRWNASVSAPGTQSLLSLPPNVYGSSMITDLLGNPDAWVLVNIGGTDYKIPAYL